jgi:tetratricopeptide (TPR) repeat protein
VRASPELEVIMRALLRTLPAVALLACAGARPVATQLAGEHWVEVKSEHFTVVTDESLDNAQEAARALERIRAALLGAAWPHATLARPDHLEVFVLDDDTTFHDLFSRNVDGLYMGSSGSGTIILHGPPGRWEHRSTLAVEGSTSVLKHELTHRLAYFVGIRQPRWLAEGLAQFLETLQISDDGKSAQLGMANLDALTMYNSVRTTTVRDALEWSGPVTTRSEGPIQGRYGLSWAMVHWFFNTHPDAFAKYQLAVTEGQSATQAWNTALPDLTPEQADVEIHGYIQHGEYQVFTLPLSGFEQVATTHRDVSAAESHAIGAQLALFSSSVVPEQSVTRLATAGAEVKAALVADPDDLRALKLAYELGPVEKRQELAHRAVKAHPEDATAWRLLGESFGESGAPEQQAAFLKASVLDPNDPLVLNALAWNRVSHGQAPQALSYAAKAARLAPADAAVLDTYATALASTGHCREAIELETRAIDFLPEDAPAAEFDEFRKRRSELASKCAAQPASNATP